MYLFLAYLHLQVKFKNLRSGIESYLQNCFSCSNQIRARNGNISEISDPDLEDNALVMFYGGRVEVVAVEESRLCRLRRRLNRYFYFGFLFSNL